MSSEHSSRALAVNSVRDTALCVVDEVSLLRMEADMPIDQLLMQYQVGSDRQDVLPIRERSVLGTKRMSETGKGFSDSVIRTGHAYQADVPEFPCAERESRSDGTVVWDGCDTRLSEEAISAYLRKLMNVRACYNPVPDHEHALHLLRLHNYDVQAASNEWRRHQRRRNHKSKSSKVTNEGNTQFSTTECDSFERGLVQFGKDFARIRRDLLPSRSLSELIRFYYLWKHSARHDALLERISASSEELCPYATCTDLMGICQVKFLPTPPSPAEPAFSASRYKPPKTRRRLRSPIRTRNKARMDGLHK